MLKSFLFLALVALAASLPVRVRAEIVQVPAKFVFNGYYFKGYDIANNQGPYPTVEAAAAAAIALMDVDGDHNHIDGGPESHTYGGVKTPWPQTPVLMGGDCNYGTTAIPWDAKTYPILFNNTKVIKENRSCVTIDYINRYRVKSDDPHGLHVLVYNKAVCPTGFSYPGHGYYCTCDSQYNDCSAVGENSAGPMCTVDGELTADTNPINPATQGKYQTEVDYVGNGDFPLTLVRTYSSQVDKDNRIFGKLWRGNYDTFVRVDVGTSEGGFETITRASGRSVNRHTTISSTGTTYGMNPSVLKQSDRFADVKDAMGVRTGWEYYDGSKRQTESYDKDGKLVKITNSEGYSQTITYDAQNRLEFVTDPQGRSMQFLYDTLNRVYEVRVPSSRTGFAYDTIKYDYALNGSNNLEKVSYPDFGKYARVYKYLAVNRQLFGSTGYNPEDLVYVLEEIQDQDGNVISHWDYDLTRRPLGAMRGSGGSSKINETSLSRNYTTGATGGTFTTALNTTSGRSQTYKFTSIAGQPRLKEVSGDICTGCSKGGFLGKLYDYDTNGKTKSRTGNNGRVDNYEHAQATLPTKRTLAAGDSENEQVVSASWDTTLRKPTFIDRPYSTIDITYENGKVKTKKITDKVTGEVRLWTNTYDTQKRFWYTDDPKLNRTVYGLDTLNQISSIRNHLGHTVTIVARNAAGDVTQIRDINGKTTTYTYTGVRERKIQSIKDGVRLTSYDYDNFGRLKFVQYPDKSSITYTYHPDGRLKRVTNERGDYTEVEYDNLNRGLVSGVKIYGSGDVLLSSASAEYNKLDQVTKITGANADEVVDLPLYDNENNIRNVVDALGQTTVVTPDTLNRVKEVTAAGGGVYKFKYDKEDRVTRVTDSNGAVTEFTYNGFGDLTKIISNDGGVREFFYDSNGNRKEYKDGHSKSIFYTYDKLDRLKSITYPDARFNTTYTYDEGVNGKGRLTTVNDVNGQTSYFYNIYGELIASSQTVAFVEYRTFYGYDSIGRLTRITYPSGREVRYNYAAGAGVVGSRISSVTTIFQGASQTLAYGFSYKPFNQLGGYILGNGLSVGFEYNNNLLLKRKTTSGIEDVNYIYDPLSRIKTITDLRNTSRNQTMSYEPWGALKTVTGTQSYSFGTDKNGNRLDTVPVIMPDSWDTAKSSADMTYTTTGFSRKWREEPAKSWAAAMSKTMLSSGNYYVEFKGDVKDMMLGVKTSASTFNNASFLGATNNSTTAGFVVFCSNTSLPNDCELWFSWVEGGVSRKSSMVLVPKSQVTLKKFGLLIELIPSSSTTVAPRLTAYMDGVQVLPSQLVNLNAPSFYLANALRSNHSGTVSFDFGRTKPSLPVALQGQGVKEIFGYPVIMGAEPLSNREVAANYDLNGNLLKFDNFNLTYNDQHRLAQINNGSEIIATYVHDVSGHRTMKRVSNKTTGFIYDQSGQLISEVDEYGRLLKEYIYFGGEVLAQIIPSGTNNLIQATLPLPDTTRTITITPAMFEAVASVFANTTSASQTPETQGTYFYHNNHLGAPFMMTNMQRALVWQAQLEPFGKANILTASITNNIRLPGQYFDSETGLHQNWTREYDPNSGRYLQIDTIGIAGGVNPYLYAVADPINKIDITGTSSAVGIPGFSSFSCPNMCTAEAMHRLGQMDIAHTLKNNFPRGATLEEVGGLLNKKGLTLKSVQKFTDQNWFDFEDFANNAYGSGKNYFIEFAGSSSSTPGHVEAIAHGKPDSVKAAIESMWERPKTQIVVHEIVEGTDPVIGSTREYIESQKAAASSAKSAALAKVKKASRVARIFTGALRATPPLIMETLAMEAGYAFGTHIYQNNCYTILDGIDWIFNLGHPYDPNDPSPMAP